MTVQVNGKRCQFKDVAKLLRAKGIDLDHNRFLILQVNTFIFVYIHDYFIVLLP